MQQPAERYQPRARQPSPNFAIALPGNARQSVLKKVNEPEDVARVSVKHGLRWQIAKNSPQLLTTVSTQIIRQTDIPKRP